MDRQRPKQSRNRGTHTHGWGAKKKHRGAGSRGGRGKAGSGKRGDANKPSYWTDKSYYKSKGFTSLKKPLKTINICDLAKFNDVKIDLRKAGFDKLLGIGKTTQKFEITVNHASESAIAKITEAGGKVSGLLSKSKKETKEEVKEVPKTKETKSKPEVKSKK